jgi:hypothetical protein
MSICRIALILTSLTVVILAKTMSKDVELKLLSNNIQESLRKLEGTLKLPIHSQSTVQTETMRSDIDTDTHASETYVTDTSGLLVNSVRKSSEEMLEKSTEKSVQVPQDKKNIVAGVPCDKVIVNAVNKDYSFVLNGIATDNWLLNKGVSKPGTPNARPIEDYVAMRRDGCTAPFKQHVSLDGPIYLTDLFSSPGFKLISSVQDKPEDPVVVKFTRAHRKKAGVTIESVFSFDPKMHWLPTRIEEKINTPDDKHYELVVIKIIIASRKIEYDNLEICGKTENDTQAITRRYHGKLESVDRIPDSKFTLSEFGLPEPVDIVSARSKAGLIPTTYWLIATALALLISSYVFWKLKMRHVDSKPS